MTEAAPTADVPTPVLNLALNVPETKAELAVVEPEPTDDSVTDFARIAGGLSDQYLRFGLGLVLTL